MRVLAGGCLLALVLRAAIVTVQADSPNNDSLPVFYKVHLEDLKILRATAYTLLIQVPSCRQSCNTVNVKFKIKTSSSVSWWAPKDVRIHPSHNDTYNIGGLLPETLYSVRAFISPPGTYTKTLVTYTCPERPAPVRGLRVAGAGPGWLDVRWAPPAPEVCVSDVEYETRYRPRGGLFAPPRVYGAVPGRRRGFVQMRPAHPCPSWPSEFCLLLVDAVLPGRNHTVEVQVHRVGGRRQEKAAVQSVEGYADPRPLTWGPDEGAPGGRGPPPSGAPHDAAVRSWFVVSLVALGLFLVFSGVVLVLLRRTLSRVITAARARQAAGLFRRRHRCMPPSLWKGVGSAGVGFADPRRRRTKGPQQRAAVAPAGARREHIQADGAGAPVTLSPLSPPSPTPPRRSLRRGCAAVEQWGQPPPPYDDAQRLHAAHPPPL